MRTTWDEYFINIAEQVSTRSTCDRKHVGAVIVRDRQVLSTGYNGSMCKDEHCDDVGHLIRDGHCVRTIHAEVNAIIQAAKNGICVNGADIYCTAFPCWGCFKIIVNAGIKCIKYRDSYRPDEEVCTRAIKLGVELIQIKSNFTCT